MGTLKMDFQSIVALLTIFSYFLVQVSGLQCYSYYADSDSLEMDVKTPNVTDCPGEEFCGSAYSLVSANGLSVAGELHECGSTLMNWNPFYVYDCHKEGLGCSHFDYSSPGEEEVHISYCCCRGHLCNNFAT